MVVRIYFIPILFHLAFLTTFTMGQNETCFPNGVIFGCKCIWTKVSDNGEGLDGSQKICRDHGGRLATFNSTDELQNMIQLTGLTAADVIIGAIRVMANGSSTYVWVDSTTETFFSRWTNITDVQVENHTCLALAGHDFKAITCNSWIRYLCERNLSATLLTSTTLDSVSLQGSTDTPGVECHDVTATPKFEKYTPTLPHTSTKSVFSPSSTNPTTSQVSTAVTMATAHLTTAPPNKEDKVLSAISKASVSNMSTIEVKVMVAEFSEVVAAAKSNNQSDVRKMTLAIVKLSTMTSCDDATFGVYATSVSAVVAMIPSTSEAGPDDGDKREQPGAILDAMESVMLATNITSATEIYESFSIRIQSFNGSEDGVVINSEDTDQIRLSSTVFSSGEGRVFTVVYKSLHMKMSRRSRKYRKVELGSKVISVAVQDVADTQRTPVKTPHAINFTVSHVIKQKSKAKSRICVFWNDEEGEWSDTGCRLLHENTSHTACTCNHLTSFAVLVLYYGDDDEISDINERVLFILSAVGCSLSILGLAMTLVSYIYLRMLHRERILIHANLAASLMLAQIVFVVSGDAHGYKVLCKIVAVLMHFFFMAAFTWMMLEGLCLYLSCLKAQYNFGDMRIKYTVIGWGVPVLVVVLSTAIQLPHYGDGPGDSCWLSAEHGLIWAFMAPMFLIVIFNLIILGLVIKVFLTLKANSHKTEAARIRAGLRAMAMLLPLLGVTWLLSVLVPYSTIFHYLFVIGNSLQGLMIFFLHCLCNEEVMNRFVFYSYYKNRILETD